MTKAEIVAEIASKTGIEKIAVQAAVETFMETIKTSMVNGQNVYLRGFGSFIIKKRAEKTGRNISRNTTLIIPAHYIPAFKPAKSFVNKVKGSVKLK
jgi:DNA-binding protein HU-beta